MLRVGLEDLVLHILLLDLGEPTSFLAKALNPPSALAMKNSLKLLEGLGAVEVRWDKASKEMVGEKGSDIVCSAISADIGLTALGFHLATLPVDPRVGKMMIYGALFGCTDAALTIAASMAARSPFLSPFDKREQATEARRTFATEGSDHLTTLSAFQQWKKLRRNKGDRAASAFLRDSFLSRLTLFQMEDLRKQFANLLVEIGFLPRTFRLSDSEQRRMDPANSNESNTALLKAILCAGLYPNIIVAPRDLVGEKPGISEAGECVFHSKKGDVHLHPSTISFTSRHFDSRYCCYHEIVKTSKTYVRDCTTVSPFALLLFGGSLHVYHSHHVVTLDEWLKFRISAKPATLVKHLRSQMESLLLKKIVNPQEDVTGSNEGRALIQAVSTLLENEKPAKLPDGAEIVQPFEMKSRSQPVLSGRGSRGGRGRGRRGGGGAGQKGRGQGSMNNGNRTS
jgi:HrpA-like RNA helicase